MSEDRILTSYCGLYCADCIPSRKDLFARVRELEGMLGELRFEKYAELKSSRHAAFRDYAGFLEVLRSIAKLECPAPCREGGGDPECAVRRCAVSGHRDGCWECGDYKTCEKPERLKGIHVNLERHLDLIRSEGVEAWAPGRGKHYSWD
jgi:hypothetical protein